jgi:hypothetical protein
MQSSMLPRLLTSAIQLFGEAKMQALLLEYFLWAGHMNSSTA